MARLADLASQAAEVCHNKPAALCRRLEEAATGKNRPQSGGGGGGGGGSDDSDSDGDDSHNGSRRGGSGADGNRGSREAHRRTTPAESFFVSGRASIRAFQTNEIIGYGYTRTRNAFGAYAMEYGVLTLESVVEDGKPQWHLIKPALEQMTDAATRGLPLVRRWGIETFNYAEWLKKVQAAEGQMQVVCTECIAL